jgi:hypothetical protein
MADLNKRVPVEDESLISATLQPLNKSFPSTAEKVMEDIPKESHRIVNEDPQDSKPNKNSQNEVEIMDEIL